MKQERRRRLRNHARTQSIDPLGIFRPESCEEIVALVQRAEEEGVSVRAVGSRHSWSDVALGPGYVMRPEGLARPLDLEEELLHPPRETAPTQLVRVEAGMRVRDLNRWLERERGLALSNMGGYDGQTIAGVISTSTHGSGLSYGPLSDFVRSIDLVAAGGKRYRIEPEHGPTDPTRWRARRPDWELVQNDERFAAVRVGMGCLGVIYAVILAVEPSYLLTEVRRQSTWEELRDDLHRGALLDPQRHRHFELFLSPYARRTDGRHPCMVTTRDRLTDTLPPWWSSHRRRNWLAELLSGAPGMGQLIRAVANALPRATPKFIEMTLNGLSDDQYTNRSYKVLNIGAANKLPAYSAEIGVPVDDRRSHVAAVERIIKIADDHRRIGEIFHTSPISLRFVASSAAHMSMMQGCDTMMIELIQLKGTKGGLEVLAAYEDALYELGGRPHWGQVNTLTGSHELVASLYRDLPQWLDAHAELNSSGVFDSPFSKRVGISAQTHALHSSPGGVGNPRAGADLTT
jgi:L-gulono-1,4-lactone dehydrogenase